MTASRYRGGGGARGFCTHPLRKAASARCSRRGAALVEFALIAFAFYFLFAGTVELGRMSFSAQIVQSAARAGARELSIVPLPATMTFQEALQDPVVRERVYDPTKLVLPDPPPSDLPIINQMLVPLMIHDQIPLVVGQPAVDVIRYPGAVFLTPDGPIVLVPHVRGPEIEFLDVVEEIVPDPDDPSSGPFSILSTGPRNGLVALRINFPYQASMLTAYTREILPNGHVRNVAVEANDNIPVIGRQPPGSPYGVTHESGLYTGPHGLGMWYALDKEVRPFSRLVSSQSIFRREVFSP
jgi:TadE-like protein